MALTQSDSDNGVGPASRWSDPQSEWLRAFNGIRRPAGRRPHRAPARSRRDLIGACATRRPSLSCPPSAGTCRPPVQHNERTAMTIVAEAPPAVDALEVTAGVDTHADDHVAAVIDPLGRHLGDRSFPATPAGYQRWSPGSPPTGPSSWSASKAPAPTVPASPGPLTAAGLAVVEVDRPDRKARRDQGKSDPIDAYAAARAAASGRARGTPKTRTGDVESIRALRVARNGAVRARAKALTQLKALIVTAPAELRSQLAELDGARLVGTCARLRPTRHEATAPSIHARRAPRPGRLVDPLAATKRALASRTHRRPQRRDRRARRRPPRLAHPAGPDAARSPRRRPGRRRPAPRHRGRQSRPAPSRGGVRSSLRSRPHPGVLGQDHPTPSQPRR